MLKIDVITLFPEMFSGPLSHSMLARAQQAGLVEIAVHQLRDWTAGKHKTVDDTSYGGGRGMVLKPEPLFAAVESLRQSDSRVILLDPAGERFTQQI
ncbi:MAG: tRNA (guanosine(37)-N1)-methyltransferase TrmD, partial [Chloroflexi bacterium]|nr:tRNA (guanosine(37)-N1)-methyltransferase TrmD [Chloroflexota bacterium]